MYECPINIIMSDIETQFEQEVLKAVQRCGISVDKDELVKALDYDRKQYEKGYADAKSEQPEIIRCGECEHWDTTWQNDYVPNYHYCPMIDGTRKDDFYCADAERRTE